MTLCCVKGKGYEAFVVVYLQGQTLPASHHNHPGLTPWTPTLSSCESRAACMCAQQLSIEAGKWQSLQPLCLWHREYDCHYRALQGYALLGFAQWTLRKRPELAEFHDSLCTSSHLRWNVQPLSSTCYSFQNMLQSLVFCWSQCYVQLCSGCTVSWIGIE